MNSDLIIHSVKSLFTRKTRSFLTVLSILIGIMAIFTLISFGLGLSKYVTEISTEMGVDKLVIQPKSFGGISIPEKQMSQDDVDFIANVKGVRDVTGLMIQSAKIQPDEDTKPKYLFLMGFTTEKEEKEIFLELMTVDLYSGRMLKKGDKLKVILGYNYQLPNKIFEKSIRLGEKILVNDVQVEVVGFFESVGNPQDDSNIYMTYEGVEELLGEEQGYEWIMARVEPGEDPKALSEKVFEKLRKFKDQEKGKEDFFVQTFQEQIEMFTNIMRVLNAVLVMIALVSVFVSGINIMNTMYTSVLERTKDIGIMKAIGAKNSDILIIFVAEAGVLGLIGGIAGILVGYGISSLAGFAVAQAGYSFLKPAFPLVLIIGSLLFATITGAGAGMAPAIQASKQEAAESLRYE
ncbi:MAG: ABC transporter permease [Nanoarchaeota archaeon]|nr:ABC transporter permease [DPANN group archaeon]MBL7116595.1 ABC transporter permease [Nanoarchaeota archaeon]